MALTTDTKVWKTLLVIILILTLLFATFMYFSMIFITLIVGIILIIFSEKIMNEFNKTAKKYNWGNFKRKLYITITILFWIVSVYVLISFAIKDIAATVTNTEAQSASISYYETNIQPVLPEFVTNFLNKETLTMFGKKVLGLLTGVLSQTTAFFINAILIIPLMFTLYFKRNEELKKTIKGLVPKKFSKAFNRSTKRIGLQLHDFLEAKIVQSLILGVICSIGFFVAGVPGALLLGMVSGFFNIIPYIGPYIGAVPALVAALFIDPFAALVVIITAILAQVIDNFYLTPFMIADKVQIDSLLSIILVLAGAKLLGVFGMIFIIPIYIVYRIVIRESYTALAEIYNPKSLKK